MWTILVRCVKKTINGWAVGSYIALSWAYSSDKKQSANYKSKLSILEHINCIMAFPYKEQPWKFYKSIFTWLYRSHQGDILVQLQINWMVMTANGCKIHLKPFNRHSVQKGLQNVPLTYLQRVKECSPNSHWETRKDHRHWQVPRPWHTKSFSEEISRCS